MPAKRVSGATIPRAGSGRTAPSSAPESSVLESSVGASGNVYAARELEPLLDALRAARRGDFSVRLPAPPDGILTEIHTAFNEVIGLNENMAEEIVRVARTVGREGRMTERAALPGATGSWAASNDSINALIEDLARPTTEVARVITAVAEGDLTQKMALEIEGTPVKGEFLRIGTTVNTMVDQLSSFAAEVTRVAREVGTEGILGGQAEVRGVSGTWKDLTDNVNGLASNLTTQVRNIALVTTAVANGDLSQKITVDARGEILELKDTINVMVDQLNSFAAEVTRVAREVGTEGRLGGQAEVRGVSGTWKDLTDNVNSLASNLTVQLRDVSKVATAIANGDLTQKITVDVRGEILQIKDVINVMVDSLSTFAGEVTRVAKEVGTEGKLGGQAEVRGVSGTWKDLTDNVNSLASNLTNQVRNIALVTTAVANGDLSKTITVDARGEILELKDTINVMVDQLNSFAAEVTRVAREVGTEGKLGGQAEVRGVSGTWKDLTDNVNSLASNLTNQVRNIALVTTAVANGDLSKKITVDVKGEILELKDTINVMVDQLNSFAAEVTRVAREVGTEGKLGGQAEVRGVSGTWKDLTDNVNFMASNLTGQVRNIALVTTAVANGDLSKTITVDARGEILELKNTVNTMVDQLNSFAAEVTRVAREVGTEGKLGGQAEVRGVSGTWKDLTDNVNIMASNLTTQVRGIVKVVTAVANGDLSQKFVLEAKGEVAALAETINSMTETLSTFAEQVTSVAREVGTEGILGGQAKVPNAAGTWKDLTDNVNFMASNLTNQVRNIAKVVTAVANGDLNQKLAVEAKGEVAALANTINAMTETLSIFAEQVTSVAREVGTEGILGGQAKVPNVAGTWKDLTDNVNTMANSLTVQVRAISDVATSVTEGDLTRTIDVEAQGEVDSLKNNINQMIGNLKETTQKNEEQDFLKTNLARFSRMMQGQKSLESVARLIMSEVTPLVGGHHGVFYINDPDTNSREPLLKLLSSYAFQERKTASNRFRLGEGLVGQCALEQKSIVLTNVPGDYIQISSGLGQAAPLTIIVLPVLFEGELTAVIELASFGTFSEIYRTFLDQLMESIGVVLNMIQANVRTEELLEQSQSLTQELQSQSQELQSQQGQLRSTNVELEAQKQELEEKASLLAVQNTRVEQKNREVELARAALEEKAEQLALSSKYKSEFLANMSHELRTPLNSMLILAKLLADNTNGNLTPKQIDFAGTIHQSGNDLLNLINEILDLSKVEAGKMEILVSDVPLAEVRDYVERSFSPVARQKGLEFLVALSPGTPTTLQTDSTRLQQVLKNLLSNAFKFTEQGRVSLTVSQHGEELSFAVRDSGIGISRDKQKLIFEAFQQADGTTSRKYGGTGLGLSISREITRLLGGRIEVQSMSGEGSTFTLFLPIDFHGDTNLVTGLDNLDGADYDGDGSYSSPASHAIFTPTRNGGPSPSTPRVSTRDVSTRAASTEPAISDVSPAGANGSELSAAANALKSQALASIRATTGEVELADDRDSLQPGDRVLLVVEDDPTFARILLDAARQQGFKSLIAMQGDVGLALAREYKPDAITLDLKLPLLDGWTVLDHLKRDPATRHIPVQVISVLDRERAALVGAISYLEKPVSRDALTGALSHIQEFLSRDVRELLLVEDDEAQRQGVIELLSGMNVDVTSAPTGQAALEHLKGKPVDCMILDLGLPDMGGFDLLRKIKKQARHQDLPVIIYTSKDLSRQEEAQLKRYAASIITKSGDSAQRLLDSTAMFLHRILENQGQSDGSDGADLASAPPAPATPNEMAAPIEAAPPTPAGRRTRKRGKAATAGSAEATATGASTTGINTTGANTGKTADLAGKTVLVVDDDMRNIFALTSALENYGLNVVFAENGQDGIEMLKSTPNISLVLMDVMMPEMDGYQTTQAIRAIPAYAELPIIALTAKAMAGDREKCLEAGASDYIAKPVDIDALLDMMRSWVQA